MRSSALVFLPLAACTNVGTLHAVDAGLGDPQTPPTGQQALDDRLMQGSYPAWHSSAGPGSLGHDLVFTQVR
jgi:hypothetical protein